jgi:hypothetical protein
LRSSDAWPGGISKGARNYPANRTIALLSLIVIRGELMNKRIFMLLMSIAFLFGCGSGFNVLVKYDPYKKATMVKVEMSHKVVEGYLHNYPMIYDREIKDGNKLPVTVFFKFYVSSYFDGKEMEDKIYILIDDKSFSLPVIDKKDETQLQTKVKGTTTGYVWSGKAHTTESRYIYGKFQLTPEIEKFILSCNNYSIRVYMNTETTTLKATDSQLKAIKQFLMVGE